MGTYRGLEEALFPALISTDFLQNLSKFCSGDAPKRVKTFERPFTRVPKIRFPLPHPPHGSSKSSTISPKNFQYFLAPLYKGHKYKVRKQAQTGPQNHKRVHGESCCGPCSGSRGGFRDTSLADSVVHHSAGLTPAPPPGSPKNLPRKATTDQNAHRCKYSLLGIQ